MTEKVMSLFDHLDELRQRLIKSAAAVLLLFVVCVVFSSQLINFLKVPLINALPEQAANLHFTGPLDVFLVGLKVSFFAAIIFASPIWIYQFWSFIEPALYKHEKKYVKPFIFFSVLLFLTGVAFCYTVILPLALQFLIGLGLEVGTPIITINDYIGMISIMIFGFGLIFETPIILILLSVLDLITAQVLADYRKFVVVGVLFVSALLTPPDPMSQVGMALPLYLMYEASILLIRFLESRRQKS